MPNRHLYIYQVESKLDKKGEELYGWGSDHLEISLQLTNS